ncbi:MAG TPA: four helix bundle protein [Opitutaceae bacterium]
MRDYRSLNVWKSGHELVPEIYGQTKTFPKDELFGLTSQLRRAAASIPANISERCGRDGDAELKRFVNIALGRRARSIISSCSLANSAIFHLRFTPRWPTTFFNSAANLAPLSKS